MPSLRNNKSICSEKQVRRIFSILRKRNPSPKTELNYTNDFTLLVAVVLSAQSTDKGVNKATDKLFAIADTPEKMLHLSQEQLCDYISSIGLFRNKSKNILGLSKALIERHKGSVPDNREDLLALPGVGQKTASVILNTIFSEHTIAVDTHVFRVSHRLGLSKAKTTDAVENDLGDIIPSEFKLYAHHWLILLGRYTCIARKPKCTECAISNECMYINTP